VLWIKAVGDDESEEELLRIDFTPKRLKRAGWETWVDQVLHIGFRRSPVVLVIILIAGMRVEKKRDDSNLKR
ncbi:Hypothetical protein FKW44_017291, partial [Caligus rogercresseyi]